MDDALDGLAQTDAQAADLVKLHYFARSLDGRGGRTARHFAADRLSHTGLTPGPGCISSSAGKTEPLSGPRPR